MQQWPSVEYANSCTTGAQTFDLHFIDPYNYSYVHVETRAEYFSRRASESANGAVEWGARGKTFTAEILAEMADLFALLARQHEELDRVQ